MTVGLKRVRNTLRKRLSIGIEADSGSGSMRGTVVADGASVVLEVASLVFGLRLRLGLGGATCTSYWFTDIDVGERFVYASMPSLRSSIAVSKLLVHGRYSWSWPMQCEIMAKSPMILAIRADTSSRARGSVSTSLPSSSTTSGRRIKKRP